MILQDRDNKIVNFLQICPADSDVLQRLFFTGKRTCNERLRKLTDYGYIKRWRCNVNNNYIYYVKRKPEQIDHCNYIAKSYLWVQEHGYSIEKFKREVSVEDLRFDALIKIRDRDKEGYLIIEVELSNNNINKKLMKYEDLFLSRKYKKYFEVMPKLLYVSNRKVQSDILDIVNVSIKEL